MNEVEFGILGPLSATRAGREIPLGPGKHRTLLACLLVRANQVVPVDELIDRLWGEDPPAGGRRVIQTYVTRLRKTLNEAGGLIRTRPPGYLLDVPELAIDAARFRAHLGQAKRAKAAGDRQTEAAELRSGLALWRGEPLCDITSESLRRDEVPCLVEERMQALDRRIEVDLALGRHAELVSELYGLVREHPLRESLWAQLMQALHRSGRQADALRAFHDVSATLREELGIDPGDALRGVHEAILLSESRPPVADTWSPVRQLPADVGTFVGRSDLVARIEKLVRPDGDPPVVVLAGPPGIGKTALAVHAAHRLAADFPDGQLYVNLRGHSAGAPMAAGDALARMLRALGVPPDKVPTELDEQSSLFRSTVAGRQILVVLDNAVSPDHVRPLLPGSRSCPVIITSRDNLLGLTAINGARRLPVDVLTTEESMALLAGIAGPATVAAEPVAAQRLAELCGRLPLALRIAAANLAGGPHRTVAEYVGLLSAGDRISALEIDGDDQSAVSVAFGLSYGTLKPEPAKLFRLLSLVPGPDFDGYAAANLAAVPLDAARTMLDRLATANLIGHDGSGRYQFHDLIRDYAAVLADQHDAERERAAGYDRLLTFYCATTDSVAEQLYPEWLRLPVPPAHSRPEPDTHLSRIAWLDKERANLVAAILHSNLELARLVCPLTAALLGYFLTQRHNRECLATITKALADAERTGDIRAQAALRFGLGQHRFAGADAEGGRDEMTRSAELYQLCGDIRGAARSTSKLAVVLMTLGDRAEADQRFEHALAVQRQIGDRAGEGLTLMRMGFSYVEYGPLPLAVDQLTRARELTEEFGFQIYAVNVAHYHGLALVLSGDPARAIADFAEAIELCTRLRFFEGHAYGHWGLALAHLALGRPEDARDDANRAVALSRKVSAQRCEVDSLIMLGAAELHEARVDEAEAALRLARRLAEEAKLPIEVMRTDVLLATCHRLRGDYRLALRTAPEPSTPTEPWCGPALAELSRIHLALGDHRAAVRHAVDSVEISRDCGYRVDEAHALEVLGSARRAAGDRETAEQAWRQALAILDEMGSLDSARVRQLLNVR
jgi:DNA-binding SARP family transcriptional activator/tetratricopeptide (TPR) repeat protein